MKVRIEESASLAHVLNWLAPRKRNCLKPSKRNCCSAKTCYSSLSVAGSRGHWPALLCKVLWCDLCCVEVSLLSEWRHELWVEMSLVGLSGFVEWELKWVGFSQSLVEWSFAGGTPRCYVHKTTCWVLQCKDHSENDSKTTWTFTWPVAHCEFPKTDCVTNLSSHCHWRLARQDHEQLIPTSCPSKQL